MLFIAEISNSPPPWFFYHCPLFLIFPPSTFCIFYHLISSSRGQSVSWGCVRSLVSFPFICFSHTVFSLSMSQLIPVVPPLILSQGCNQYFSWNALWSLLLSVSLPLRPLLSHTPTHTHLVIRWTQWVVVILSVGSSIICTNQMHRHIYIRWIYCFCLFFVCCMISASLQPFDLSTR